MLAKINLDKEKVLRFFNIKSIPSISNGFKVIEHKGNFYITGKGNHAPIHVHNQIELAFMKSNCPYIINNKPVILANKYFEEKDITDILTSLGYKDYTNKIMYFPHRRIINEYYERKIQEALSLKNPLKHYNKIYDLMCITRDSRLYKLLKRKNPSKGIK